MTTTSINPAALIKRRVRARRARAIQAASALRTANGAQTRKEPRRLPDMPDCLKTRKPGDILGPEQTIEVLDWMAECVRDAGRRAGLQV